MSLVFMVYVMMMRFTEHNSASCVENTTTKMRENRQQFIDL